MNAKIKMIVASLLCTVSMSVLAQEENVNEAKVLAQEENVNEAKVYAPEAGRMAIGVSFNPVAAAQGGGATSFSNVGQFLYGTSTVKPDGEVEKEGLILTAKDNPKQMYILAQQPMVSISFKYQLKQNLALKASAGFSGGYAVYREYVIDDKALALDPVSQALVADAIKLNYTGGGITAGIEYSLGKNFRFVCGAGLIYSFGGGDVSFEYGNQITSANQVPTVMDKITDLNEFSGTRCEWLKGGRPVKQYNVGVSNGIGIYANLGFEWFLSKKISLGATVDITPLMLAFQPKTYTIYEGYDIYHDKVSQYNELVSPGSMYLLYGTESIGVNVSLHYYF